MSLEAALLALSLGISLLLRAAGIKVPGQS